MSFDPDLIAKIIDKVFPPGSSPAWNADDVPPQERFWVIPGKSGPRWIIPRNPLLGWPALRQWRPYDLSSRLKWAAITTAYRTGQLGMMPDVALMGVAGSSHASWEHVGWQLDSVPLPVIYVGTAGPTRKAVATLVDRTRRLPISVAKVPLGPRALGKILREAEILDRLAGEKPELAPSLFFVDRERGVAVQEVVRGWPTGRRLTKRHIEWLAGLRIPGVETSLRKQAGRLAHRLAGTPDVIDEVTRSSLNQILEKLEDTTRLPAVWVHGDFAPWNLKWVGRGKLRAVDWEFAEAGELPGLDVVHYICHVNLHHHHGFTSINKLESAVYNALSRLEIPHLCKHTILAGLWRYYVVWYLVVLAEHEITGLYGRSLMGIIRRWN